MPNWCTRADGSADYWGIMLVWMQAFNKWYDKDVRAKPHDKGINSYVLLASTYYARRAQGHWLAASPDRVKLYQRRLDGLQILLTIPNGSVKESLTGSEVMNLLDFLSSNIDEKLMKAWERDVREHVVDALRSGA